jgi:hypothetical protein
VDIRWLGLTLHTALLRTAELGGDLRWGPREPSGKVTLILARPVVPSGALGEGEAEQSFESGKGLLRVDPEGVEVVSLRLLGADSCLRAAGRISLEGEADLVVLISGPPAHLALSALPEESRPPQWRSAVGSSFRAFRISGPMASPQARPIGEQDPAFASAR